MAFINENSCECAKSELDLFGMGPTQTSIETSSYCEYHPLTSLDGNNTIDFEIGGSGEDYVDLNNTLLRIKAKITQTNGANLPDDDAVAPVNYFMHSLFSQIDIFVNGTQITSSTNTYAYRAILEALLSFGNDAKKTQLAAAMYYKDEGGKMDAIAVDDDDSNSGFMSRRHQTRQSRIVDMIGRIHSDMLFQDRYLLNEVTIKIRLTRNKDSFCLMGAHERTVKIVGAQLLVRKVKLSPSVLLAHAQAIEVSSAKYPIKKLFGRVLPYQTVYAM